MKDRYTLIGSFNGRLSPIPSFQYSTQLPNHNLGNQCWRSIYFQILLLILLHPLLLFHWQWNIFSLDWTHLVMPLSLNLLRVIVRRLHSHWCILKTQYAMKFKKLRMCFCPTWSITLSFNLHRMIVKRLHQLFRSLTIYKEGLNNETTATTNATITQPYLGDSKDVSPSSMQPNEIDSSTDNVQSVPSQNELSHPNSRQRLLLTVYNRW